jgi:hypothetical protein
MKSGNRLESASFPWQPLVEGSDSIGRLAVKLAAYKGTAAGYAVAAAHLAALRQAEIPYSFRPRRDANYPSGYLSFANRSVRLKRPLGAWDWAPMRLNEPTRPVFSRGAFSLDPFPSHLVD